MCETEKASVVVSFFSVHGHILIPEFMENKHKDMLRLYVVRTSDPCYSRCENTLNSRSSDLENK